MHRNIYTGTQIYFDQQSELERALRLIQPEPEVEESIDNPILQTVNVVEQMDTSSESDETQNYATFDVSISAQHKLPTFGSETLPSFDTSPQNSGSLTPIHERTGITRRQQNEAINQLINELGIEIIDKNRESKNQENCYQQYSSTRTPQQDLFYKAIIDSDLQNLETVTISENILYHALRDSGLQNLESDTSLTNTSDPIVSVSDRTNSTGTVQVQTHVNIPTIFDPSESHVEEIYHEYEQMDLEQLQEEHNRLHSQIYQIFNRYIGTKGYSIACRS